MLPDKWRKHVLCIDCFIEEIDNVLDKRMPLTLKDFDFIGIIGKRLKLIMLDRNPR